MAEKLVGIYFIKNSANAMFYVGSSVDINRRLKGHLNNLRKGKHVNHLLQRDWNQFGEAVFSTGVLDIVSVEDLIKYEQAWIDHIGDYNLAPAAGSTLGFKQSEEFKANQRARMTGENNPMFGKKRPEVGERLRAVHSGRKLTEEHKAKCSAALKGKGVGKVITQEQREAISRANTGRKRTPEQLLKMSEVQKNRPPVSDETREKLRVANTGKRHTDETKEKMATTRRGKKLNLSAAEIERRRQVGRNGICPPDKRQLIAEAQRGLPRPDDVVAKMSLAMTGKKRSAESRQKQSTSVSGENNPRFGKPVSEETKRKISETKLRNAVLK